jgi:hypothetical protein
MAKLNIKKTIEVNSNPNQPWEIIGPKFLDISKWARSINKSYSNEQAPKNFNNAPAGGRYCEVNGFGKMKEEILHFDAQKQEITWSAEGEKLPGFVNGLQNALKVEKIGENSSRITTHITADLSGIGGFLMGGMIKKNFDKVLAGFLKDLKIYAETGEISETKQRELRM